MGIGIQGHVGIGLEATWGTAVAADNYMEILNESLASNFDRFITRNAHGAIYEPERVYELEPAA